MPEIPNYQSRGLTPASSGLTPAPAGIVGGQPIEQGFSNLATGMLTKDYYDYQQDQQDQVFTASRLAAQIAEAADAKEHELKTRQSTDPVDPRLLNSEYQEYVGGLIQGTLDDPTVQAKPTLHKYFGTHIDAAMASRKNSFEGYTDHTWKNWSEFNTLDGVKKLGKAAERDPSLASEYLRLADKALAGATLSGALTGQQADAAKAVMMDSYNYTKGLSFANANSTDWVNSRHAGKYPEGFDHSKYTTAQLKDFDSSAIENYNMQGAMNKDAESKERQVMEDYYTTNENDWKSLHLPHQDQAGNKLPPESTSTIITKLGTKEAKAQLGPKYSSTLSYYEDLDRHDRSGASHKPTPEEYGRLLIDIHQGKYGSTTAVTKAAMARNFDIPSINEAVSAFNSDLTLFNTDTQHRIGQGTKIIEGKFDTPTSLLIDPAKARIHQTNVFTRYSLWVEAIKEKYKNNPAGLAEVDFIGTAQTLSDNEYQIMADAVVTILPRTKANLPFQTPAEAEKAYDKGHGTISRHQRDSALREIDNFERLEQIAEQQSKKAAPKSPLR